MSAVHVLLVAALGTSPVSAQGAQGDLTDPVVLFRTVCMSDRVALSKRDVAAVEYEAVPAAAKEALGFSLPPTDVPRTVGRLALPDDVMRGRVLAVLPQKASYLVLPASGEGNDRSSRVCAVVWRGRHFSDAFDVMAELSSPVAGGRTDKDQLMTTLRRGSGVPGLHYVSSTGSGLVAGAAEYDGWTVLRAAPDLAPVPERQLP